MGKWMLTRLVEFLLIVFGGATMSLAAETLAALDLVSSDVAFCLEIPRLNETWTALEHSPLMDRVRAFPPYQRFFESPGFSRWKSIDDHVAKTSGQRISAQLRALFAKSLVLAVYVPPSGDPQGILIGEAYDKDAVQTAFVTWNGLEPKQITTERYHNGHRYYRRLRQADANEQLFLARSERWFAISDQESLIHDVIDRFVAATSTNDVTPNPVETSLRRSDSFVENRNQLKENSAAYVHINARPWDRILAECPYDVKDPIRPADVWKYVSTVSSALRFDRGIVCDSIIELDESKLASEWTQFVTTASNTPTWNGPVSSDAFFAFSAHLEIAPVLQAILNQVRTEDLVEFGRLRRIAKSLFGGNDLIDVVLPAIARNASGFLLARMDDVAHRFAFDGMIRVSLSPAEHRTFRLDVDRGIETGLSLLAAYFSAEQSEVVTLEREQSDSVQYLWLSESAPFPVAVGIKDQTIAIGRSKEVLQRSLDSHDTDNSNTRLTQDSGRYFPDANQVIWIDVIKVRNLIEKHGASIAKLLEPGSTEFDHIRPALQLLDSAFAAVRVESNRIRVTLGGGLEGN